MSRVENLIKNVLSKYRTVAIVGLSRDPEKDSYRVARYLAEHGFKIIPVNPNADVILGEKCTPVYLRSWEEQKMIEIVDIFRLPGEVPGIVEQAVQLRKFHGKSHVIWTQLGIINE